MKSLDFPLHRKVCNKCWRVDENSKMALESFAPIVLGYVLVLKAQRLDWAKAINC